MNDHTHKMTDEEWEVNKDCEAKKRDHHWVWKHDIASGTASPTEAICAHCGKHAHLTRKELRIKDERV